MKRALVVPYRYLGDTLMAFPLAAALKRAGWRVEWLAAPGAEGLLAGQPCVDAVHPLPLNRSGTLRLIGRCFRAFAASFVMKGDADRLLLFGRMLGQRCFAAFRAPAPSWKKRLCTKAVAFTEREHTLAHALALARAAGLEAQPEIAFAIPEEARKAAPARLGNAPRPCIVMHPFGRGRYKTLADARWQEIIAALRERGASVRITCAPADRAHAETIAGKKAEVLCGLPWPELAAIYRAADAFIGVDTANTHLAAAVGARVVALFGATNPVWWGPWPNGFAGATPWHPWAAASVQRQERIALVQNADWPCVPCALEGCERRRDRPSRCLETLPVARILEALDMVLEEEG